MCFSVQCHSHKLLSCALLKSAFQTASLLNSKIIHKDISPFSTKFSNLKTELFRKKEKKKYNSDKIKTTLHSSIYAFKMHVYD